MVRVSQNQPIENTEFSQPFNNFEVDSLNLSAQPLSSASNSSYLNQVNSFNKLLLPQLQKASPQELATQGQIREIKPGLLSCHFVDKAGHALYFARETMDENKAILWDHFSEANEKICDGINYKLSELFGLNFDTDNIDSELTPEETAEHCFQNLPANTIIMNLVTDLGLNENSALNTVRSLENISLGSSVFYADKDISEDARYAVYVSSKPITDYALHHLLASDKSDIDLTRLQQFAENTDHILMVVGSGVGKNVTEHRGIFKTPLATLNRIKPDLSEFRLKQGALSMALHLFGMQCAKQDGIRYFTISPADMMHSIFFKTMYSDIKKNRIAVGRDDIAANGWTQHIRDSADDEQPIVCDLAIVRNKLFNIKSASSAV